MMCLSYLFYPNIQWLLIPIQQTLMSYGDITGCLMPNAASHEDEHSVFFFFFDLADTGVSWYISAAFISTATTSLCTTITATTSLCTTITATTSANTTSDTATTTTTIILAIIKTTAHRNGNPQSSDQTTTPPCQ
jgi:hypothetical protein